MNSSSKFADLVDAIDRLSIDDQHELVQVLRTRLAARERERLTNDIASGRADFARGQLTARSVHQIMSEIEE